MEDFKINFFSEQISYTLKNKKIIRKHLQTLAKTEKKDIGILNFIFCNDKYLLEINKTYLKKNYFTDVISFDYSEKEKLLSGDIFISIERAKENAKTFKTTKTNEIHRLIIHGLLHLIGFNDKTPEEKILMKQKEDKYLSLLFISK